MSGRFNTSTTATALRSPVQTAKQPAVVNHHGGPGYARDTKSELSLLAVTNMVSAKTFYEDGSSRDARFEQLVRQAATSDPLWTRDFLHSLRTDANMRTAPIVGAVEAAHAMAAAKVPGARQIVAGVQQRGDEPGELTGCWLSRYGRAIPMPVKRGIGEGVWRLYTERSLLKYDSPDKAIRFGDVIELTHPTGTLPAERFPIRGTFRGDLYQFALDRRHNRDNPVPESLRMIAARRELMARPVAQRKDVTTEELAAAGMTWEALAGWRQAPMDAAAWQLILPQMNFMAKLRNLRNFDQAGIDDEIAGQIAAQLTDPAEVAGSRQFPFRFLSAYRAVPSLRWAYPLEKALNLSLANVPALPGRTLILVDQSPSMFPGAWYTSSTGADERMGICLADQAKIFGTALALRAASADLVQYGQTSELVPFSKGDSLLKLLDKFRMMNGTATAAAAQRWFAKHDRVVIITDEQTGGDLSAVLPQTLPVYTWNLGGYKYGHGPSGLGRWHTFGGLTDMAFRAIPWLEAGRDVGWPWELKTAA